jgi:hypothetical protein
MRKLRFSTICFAIGAAAILPALAQPAEDLSALKCADFRHNSDGSWSPVREVTIQYPNGNESVGPQVTFPARGTYMGVAFAQILNQRCLSR